MRNWLISPRLWDFAFDALESEEVGLCLDSSHLIWQFINSYSLVTEYASRIFHVQAKDTEILPDHLVRGGILTDFTWWENRIPEFDELNWTCFLNALDSVAYQGWVSVEHEDPNCSGTAELVDRGLVAAKPHLKACSAAMDTHDDIPSKPWNESRVDSHMQHPSGDLHPPASPTPRLRSTVPVPHHSDERTTHEFPT